MGLAAAIQGTLSRFLPRLFWLLPPVTTQASALAAHAAASARNGRTGAWAKLGQIFTVLSLTQQAGIAFLQGLESVEETVESGTGKPKCGRYANISSKESPCGQPFSRHQSLPRCAYS